MSSKQAFYVDPVAINEDTALTFVHGGGGRIYRVTIHGPDTIVLVTSGEKITVFRGNAIDVRVKNMLSVYNNNAGKHACCSYEIVDN